MKLKAVHCLAIASLAVLALTIKPSQAEMGAIALSPKLPELSKPTLPAYLETLRTTKSRESQFVGIEPTPSKVFQAFEQAMKEGKKIRPELNQILESGTPAGKMYAVTVLASFDPGAAKQVLERMRYDNSTVPEVSGDCAVLINVGEWATATLKGLATSKQAVLPPHLATLRETIRLEGRALGYAGTPSKIYKAFEQALQLRKTTRSDIDRLLQESTPAGRIYTAMLLVKLDAKAGRQLLEQMRSDQTPLTEASGCEISQTSVGAAVEDILQGRSSVFLPLS